LAVCTILPAVDVTVCVTDATMPETGAAGEEGAGAVEDEDEDECAVGAEAVAGNAGAEEDLSEGAA
jgi:hypothetical protein